MAAAITEGRPLAAPDEETTDALQARFCTFLGCSPKSRKHLSAEVVRALGRAAHDRDMEEVIPSWLTPEEGAPLGFDNDIPVTGVFPPIDASQAPADPGELVSTLHGWSNYVSVEESLDVALGLVHSAAGNGFCRIFDDISRMQEFVGTSDITLQRLALISKLRADNT